MLFLYGKWTYPPSKLYTIDITSRAKDTIDITSRAKDNTIMQERLRKQVVDSIK